MEVDPADPVVNLRACSSGISRTTRPGKTWRITARGTKSGRFSALISSRTLRGGPKAAGNILFYHGFGLICNRIIEFDNPRSATRAKQILNGTKINGREIFASFVFLKKLTLFLWLTKGKNDRFSGNGGNGGGRRSRSRSRSRSTGSNLDSNSHKLIPKTRRRTRKRRWTWWWIIKRRWIAKSRRNSDLHWKSTILCDMAAAEG